LGTASGAIALGAVPVRLMSRSLPPPRSAVSAWKSVAQLHCDLFVAHPQPRLQDLGHVDFEEPDLQGLHVRMQRRDVGIASRRDGFSGFKDGLHFVWARPLKHVFAEEIPEEVTEKKISLETSLECSWRHESA
jgi:hypothetical protein